MSICRTSLYAVALILSSALASAQAPHLEPPKMVGELCILRSESPVIWMPIQPAEWRVEILEENKVCVVETARPGQLILITIGASPEVGKLPPVERWVITVTDPLPPTPPAPPTPPGPQPPTPPAPPAPGPFNNLAQRIHAMVATFQSFPSAQLAAAYADTADRFEGSKDPIIPTVTALRTSLLDTQKKLFTPQNDADWAKVRALVNEHWQESDRTTLVSLLREVSRGCSG